MDARTSSFLFHPLLLVFQKLSVSFNENIKHKLKQNTKKIDELGSLHSKKVMGVALIF